MAPHVKTKRKTLRLKHKIEKKVKEHHKKVRRSSKAKVAGPTRKNKRKDPGIPNLWPFKQELMDELERKRQDARASKNALAKERRAVGKVGAASVSSMEALRADASQRGLNFENGENKEDGENDDMISPSGEVPDGSRKAFMKEFRRVVESSDVILEVLDARDPLGCRCFDAERAVVASSGGTKRIVLVLNKVDLVPRDIADKWLMYLRNDFPTIAFRASIQGGRSACGRVGQADMNALAASSVGTSEALGAGTLLSLLKNYSRSRNIKTSITVGVIGFPNVGKSSLINSLKRSRVVSTGAMPGLTRSAQEIQLDKNIRLIDCPGIVFSDQQAEALVLRNCIKIENLADPISPVEIILKRVGPEPLMVAYAVPAFDNTLEFLAFIAKSRGKYKRGGALDVAAAAVVVLQDWNGGKIPFYTLPPKGPRHAHLSASVVQDWSREFDINEDVKLREGDALDCIPRAGPADRAQFTDVPGALLQYVEASDVQELNESHSQDIVSGADSVGMIEDVNDVNLNREVAADGLPAIDRPVASDIESTYHAAPVSEVRPSRRNPRRSTRSSTLRMDM
jgi:nuclear GTP-binding protein